MNMLIELVRLHPSVRACIQRLISEAVPESVQISEGGKPIKPALQKVLAPFFATFLENSIEMAYMCGFVVFTRSKHEGVPIPLLLPLGSFSWGVEMVTERTKKRKRECPNLYRYSVHPHHPEVNLDDIYVFEYLPPAIRNQQCLPSPLDKLCTLRFVMDVTEDKIQKVLEWNCQKHIVTSEQVNIPKDTTTEGISLLDDFRRYLVTGDHLGLNKRFLTMNGLRAHMSQNPSNLSNWKIKEEFKNDEMEKVHILPPNTDVHELAGLKLETSVTELHELMQRQVSELFQMPLLTDMGSKDISAFVQQKEIKQMKYMSNFIKRLLQYTYAAIFDVPLGTIEVQCDQPSAMHINSVDDVKKLHESNTLLPSDKLKIRKHLMKNL
jgi:hypothetical protein